MCEHILERRQVRISEQNQLFSPNQQPATSMTSGSSTTWGEKKEHFNVLGKVASAMLDISAA